MGRSRSVRVGVVARAACLFAALGGSSCGRLGYESSSIDASPIDAQSIDAPSADGLLDGPLDSPLPDTAADVPADSDACPEGSPCPGGGTCRQGACCTGCWEPTTSRCVTGDELERCGAGGRTCRACSCLGDACVSGLCDAANPFQTVEPGDSHTCAIRSGAVAMCWGSHAIGQTGTGPVGEGVSPRGPTAVLDGARQISGAFEHVCLRTDAGVRCWGRGWEGQLGHGVAAPSGVPVVALADTSVVDLDTGFITSVLVTSSGEARVWGRNTAEGFLGLGSAIDDVGVPTVLASSGILSAGLGHTHGCLVSSGGGLRCFGANDTGQLGTGATSGALPTPTATVGLEGVSIASVDGGFVHTCALDAAGGLWCTGGNVEGSLGLGDRDARTRFERVGVERYRALAMGARGLHTCALTVDDRMQCWGRNAEAQIALGLADALDVPTHIDLGPVVGIGAGTRHTCAITLGGALYCWGDNRQGQVRAGAPTDVPSDVFRVCVP